MKRVLFRPPAEGQPAPTIDMPFQDFLREKLEAHWDESPEVRQRASELMPLIVEDCLRPSEEWPAYMPNLSKEYVLFPCHPWMCSMRGAFAWYVITVAIRFTKYPEKCPFAEAA